MHSGCVMPNMSARYAYSEYSLDPRFSGVKIMTPKNNYLFDTTMSLEYRGSGWYVPRERRWERYHEHPYLPKLNAPDSVEFVREKEYVDFAKKRDRYRAPLIQSYLTTRIPDFMWYRHQRDGHTIPPKPNQRVGVIGSYPHFYEGLDRHMAGEFRKLPIYAMRSNIGVPLPTDEKS